MKITTTTLAILAASLLAMVLLVVTLQPVNAETVSHAINVRTEPTTVDSCLINVMRKYASGISYSGTCKGGYWWSTWVPRYRVILWRPGDCVSVRGVLNAKKQITGASIVGLGWRCY